MDKKSEKHIKKIVTLVVLGGWIRLELTNCFWHISRWAVGLSMLCILLPFITKTLEFISGFISSLDRFIDKELFIFVSLVSIKQISHKIIKTYFLELKIRDKSEKNLSSQN